MKNVPASCENFVCISLVADIPYKLIIRRVENVMNGNSQFNGPQAGTQMAGVMRNHINNVLPNLAAQYWKIIILQLAQIFRRIDGG